MDPSPKTIELRANKIQWNRGSRQLHDNSNKSKGKSYKGNDLCSQEIKWHKAPKASNKLSQTCYTVFCSFKVLTIITLKSNTLGFFSQKLTNLEIEKSATDLQLGESMARDHKRNDIVINFPRHCALSTQPFWLHLAHMQPENLQNIQNMHFWKKARVNGLMAI